MTYPSPQLSIAPQRGAALVVSLVMMVILTLIGVVAMNSSSIELIMAGNTQLNTRALVDAERALVTAESAVENMDGIDTTFTLAGYYNIVSGTSTPVDPQTLDWGTADSAQAGADSQHRYVIEYASHAYLDGSSIVLGAGAGAGGDEVDVFRVTARAEDAKGAVRMVQSIYVKSTL